MSSLREMMSRPKAIAVAVVVLLIIVIAIQNIDSVNTKILFMNVSMPRTVLILVTTAIGFIAGMFYGTKRRK